MTKAANVDKILTRIKSNVAIGAPQWNNLSSLKTQLRVSEDYLRPRLLSAVRMGHLTLDNGIYYLKKE